MVEPHDCGSQALPIVLPASDLPSASRPRHFLSPKTHPPPLVPRPRPPSTFPPSTKTHEKGLDVLLASEAHVLVLDDTEHVWQAHKRNLIQVHGWGGWVDGSLDIAGAWGAGDCRSLSRDRSRLLPHRWCFYVDTF